MDIWAATETCGILWHWQYTVDTTTSYQQWGQKYFLMSMQILQNYSLFCFLPFLLHHNLLPLEQVRAIETRLNRRAVLHQELHLDRINIGPILLLLPLDVTILFIESFSFFANSSNYFWYIEDCPAPTSVAEPTAQWASFVRGGAFWARGELLKPLSSMHHIATCLYTVVNSTQTRWLSNATKAGPIG